MPTKFKLLMHTAASLVGMLALLGISSCGKPQRSLENPQFISHQFILDKNNNASFSEPSPEATPQLKYTPISSIFPNPSDITVEKNTKEILSKLKAVSSLTQAYHQELYDILKNSASIDYSHLILMADANYFTNETYDKMKTILGDPRSCGNLTPKACQEKLAQVKANAVSANLFGVFINQILITGLTKLTNISSHEAFNLLNKSYPKIDSTNILFKETLNELKNLSAEEKLSFIDLAVYKSALAPALDLGIDWLKNNSDKTSESFLFIANKFPFSETRDQLLKVALDLTSNIVAEDAKKISILATNPFNLIILSLDKISELKGHDIAELASLSKTEAEQSKIISLGLLKIKSISNSEAVELLTIAKGNKVQMAKILIPLISDFKPIDLVSLVKNTISQKDREEIILANLYRFSSFSLNEAKSVLDATQNTLRFVLQLLPKTNLVTATDLAHLVEKISLGTERDEALLAGIKQVHSVDTAGISELLKLAYNTKVTVTSAMLAKLPSLSANDLALISKECLEPAIRDQLLLKASSFISIASLEGSISVISLATEEKVSVALSAMSKIPKVSTSDLGLILRSISDGKTRDRLIKAELDLLKVYETNGSALVVDRSFESKLETATRLLALIPNVTGTDLDKILAVCGSGNTRDLILGNGIKLLNRLTKEEARSLYSRAYDNKETVAVLLISKIDFIDGKTVGEIARFSNKGTTRDLIIAEGLKRLSKIDAVGLIIMIEVSFKLTEKLALEVSNRIENFTLNNAFDITNAIANTELKDRFLVHTIDLLNDLDESIITMLALKATSRNAKKEIVEKGSLKIGDTI